MSLPPLASRSIESSFLVVLWTSTWDKNCKEVEEVLNNLMLRLPQARQGCKLVVSFTCPVSRCSLELSMATEIWPTIERGPKPTHKCRKYGRLGAWRPETHRAGVD